MRRRALEVSASDETGATLVIVAIVMVALMGAAALALDIGMARARKLEAHTAADAAALAGAEVIGAGDPTAVASDYAAKNGFNSPAVHSPPASGSHVGAANCVEVNVHDNVKTYFAAALGISQISVAARAVACTMPGTGPCALCVLSSTASPALSGTGNGSITVLNNGVVVNSTGNPAASLTGNANVAGTSIAGPGAPSKFRVTGDATYHPTPTTRPAIPDPLASLPMCPAAGAPNPCPTVVQSNVSVTANGSLTISPGIYNTISVSSNGSVTMQPGTYIIKNSLSVTGNGSLTANGVTLYIACGSYPTPCNSGQSGATFNLTGNGAIKISAPNTGVFKGLSIFADRKNAAGSSLTGNGSSIGGTFYLQSGGLTFTGNGQTLNSLIVVDRVTLTGNGNVTINALGAANVEVPSGVALVE